MARQTFLEIIADIQRAPGLGSIGVGEIMDHVNTAAKDMGNQAWPWNYAETNVLVPAPYSTGTVSVNDGSATVNGNLTVWNTAWYGRRIRFGNSNLDYIVQTIVNPTTITLAQPVNLGTNLVNSPYTIYQDTYLYPADYIMGSDVALLQPTIRARIPKIPRYKFEMIMNAGLRSFSTNIQLIYCDHGQDLTIPPSTTAGLFRFRLGPPPAGPTELRLCYHQMAPDMVLAAQTTLPDGFDEIISLLAQSKLYDLHKMPNESAGAKSIAAGKMSLLKRQVAVQTIDDLPDAAYEIPNSSISQWGLTISRM